MQRRFDIKEEGKLQNSKLMFIKGEACTSDTDCPTTHSEIFAKCKCGHNAKGLKYCDIEGGDSEWTDAFEMFESYYERSQNCHTSEGFGPCNDNQYFVDFKCAELKAKLFVYLIEIPTCLQNLMDVHPFFYEYTMYCTFSVLGLSSAISASFLALSLLFIF